MERAGRGKRGAFPWPARRNGGRSDSWQPTPPPWQRPSPLPLRHGDIQRAGGQSPRPAHDPPSAGASPPPGPALASRFAGCDGPRAGVPYGRGIAVRFLVPPGDWAEGQTLGGPPRPNGKGHRLCHSATVTPNGPGAKAPGQRTPRQWRALSHPPGPALASRFAGGTGPRAGVPHGRGNAVRFLVPPGTGAEGQTLGGPPRPNGKGHRLCHSATVTSNGPGAKAPGQSARPAIGGRLKGAGETRCVSPAQNWRGARMGGFRAAAAGRPQPQPAARGAAIRRSGLPARKPVHQGLGSGYLAGKGFGPGDAPAAAQRRLGHHTRSASGRRGAGNPTPPQSLPKP